jgi:hypothetical protein
MPQTQTNRHPERAKRAEEPAFVFSPDSKNAVILSEAQRAEEPAFVFSSNSKHAVILSEAQRSRRTCICLSLRTQNMQSS